MRKRFRSIAPLVGLCLSLGTHAQRYLSEVFTPAQVHVTPDVVFGQNIDFLTSDFSNPSVFGPQVMELQGDVTNNQPIPAAYFNPADNSTAVKVTNVMMDVYEPDQGVDDETARPVFIHLHSGNLLPPPVNGSSYGTRKDSSAVEICRRMARRGYVAVSMTYRMGWNPLGSTLEIRRGTLLNAVYRAIHDLKQCIRSLKAGAAADNPYAIDPNKIIVYGDGTGGYIDLATATLDHPSELYIEKFRPDESNPDVSYVDSTQVGNIEGFGGALCLYRPNGQNSHFNFCVNAGGAMADTSWQAPGDVPMVAFHATFDPFAPFTEGVVIVPVTGEQVLLLQGSNLFIHLADQYGNNAAFATLPSGDIYTDRARSLYGTTLTHGGGPGNDVHIYPGDEGLYPFVTPNWPAQIPGTTEESSPWQWWDPNGALAQTVVNPGPPPVTAGQVDQASNPNFSPAKGRAYIDTIMGYMNPRIVCALDLGPCSLVGINDHDPIAVGVDLYPNPAHDHITITSAKSIIRFCEVRDINGRRVHAENVEKNSFILQRGDLKPGAYFVTLQFDEGTVTRKVMLD